MQPNSSDHLSIQASRGIGREGGMEGEREREAERERELRGGDLQMLYLNWKPSSSDEESRTSARSHPIAVMDFGFTA